jgi:hypothetical protein
VKCLIMRRRATGGEPSEPEGGVGIGRIRRRRDGTESARKDTNSVEDALREDSNSPKPVAQDEKPSSDTEDEKPVDKSAGISEAEEKPQSKTERGAKDDHKPSETDGLSVLEKDIERGPLRVFEPIRSDPIAVIKSRMKKIERLPLQNVPELHFIGKLLSGEGIISESTEGVSCR